MKKINYLSNKGQLISHCTLGIFPYEANKQIQALNHMPSFPSFIVVYNPPYFFSFVSKNISYIAF